MRDSFEVGPLDKQQGEQEEQQAVFAPADSRPNRFGIALALLSLYFIWGSTYLGIRIAIESIPPLLMIGVRFLVAGGILYLVLRVRGVPSPKRSQWMGSAAVGVLLIGGGFGGGATAQPGGPPGVAAVWFGTSPFLILLFFRPLGPPPLPTTYPRPLFCFFLLESPYLVN